MRGVRSRLLVGILRQLAVALGTAAQALQLAAFAEADELLPAVLAEDKTGCEKLLELTCVYWPY